MAKQYFDIWNVYSMGVQNNGIWEIRKKITGVGGRQTQTIYKGTRKECEEYWDKNIDE